MHFFKPFTIAILCVLTGLRSVCQDDYKYANVDNKFYISISPGGFIDYKDGSSIRLSADARVYKNIALSIEAGFYTSFGNVFSYKTDPRGFLIKPCIKVYFDKKSNGGYIGLEYQYKRQTYTEYDSIDISRTSRYGKTYGITRYVNCINAKYGELKNITKRIIWEWYVGAGIRFFNSFTDLSQDEYDGILRGESRYNTTGGGYSARVIGRHVYPNITIGIKLGVRL
jgi:hypothetical protein